MDENDEITKLLAEIEGKLNDHNARLDKHDAQLSSAAKHGKGNITDVKLSETKNLVSVAVPVADEESQDDTINSKPSDKAAEDKVIDEESQNDTINSKPSDEAAEDKVIDEESQDDSINSNTESHGDASMDMEHDLSNTESFHLQAVFALTADHSTSRGYKERLQKWIMPIALLLLTMLQLLILYWLIFEASFPTCSMYSDCNIGEYCDRKGGSMEGYFHTPRCNSCRPKIVDEDKLSSCKAYGDASANVLVWISGDGKYNPSNLNNEEAIDCLESLYCDGTDTGDSACGYLDLNLTKITWPNIIVFLFVSILFATYLYQDIKESMVEEILLDHALTKTTGTHQSAAQKSDTQFLSWIVRLTLRIKKFVLPWSVTAAATTVIVVDSLSAKNILLNLLAIAFITEVDNLFNTMFISDNQKRLADDFVNQSKEELHENDIKISSYLWLRILSVAPVIVMVAAILKMKEFLSIFSGDCNHISTIVALVFSIFFPFTVVLIESVLHLFTDSDRNKIRTFIKATLQICQNNNAVFLSIVIYYAAQFAVKGKSGEELKAYGLVFSIGFLVNITFGYLLSREMERGLWICIGATFSALYLAVLSVSLFLGFIVLFIGFLPIDYPEWLKSLL